MDRTENRNSPLGASRPTPQDVSSPSRTRDSVGSMLREGHNQAQEVPDEHGLNWPRGNLFLPVERATDEFEQIFGRRPSVFEVAAGVASRPDFVEPVSSATLRWPGPNPPGLADSWFIVESAGDVARRRVERAAIAGVLLACLQEWEEQVIRSRRIAHMTDRELAHAVAFSQLSACQTLVRGFDVLDTSSTQQSRP